MTRDIEFVSSYLLVLEMEAIAGRQASSPDVNVQAIPEVLARIGTISLDRATAEIACALVRRLRRVGRRDRSRGPTAASPRS